MLLSFGQCTSKTTQLQNPLATFSSSCAALWEKGPTACGPGRRTFALLDHGLGLGESKTLHGLVARPSWPLLHRAVGVAKLDQHPASEGVTLLSARLASPGHSIYCGGWGVQNNGVDAVAWKRNERRETLGSEICKQPRMDFL